MDWFMEVVKDIADFLNWVAVITFLTITCEFLNLRKAHKKLQLEYENLLEKLRYCDPDKSAKLFKKIFELQDENKRLIEERRELIKTIKNIDDKRQLLEVELRKRKEL